jgi:hypothetical protein
MDQTYDLFDSLIRAIFGGVLFTLNGWVAQPFSDGPDVIGQPGGHRWRPLPPAPFLIALAERPHRTAEVGTEQTEATHRLMDLPVLREAIGRAHLATVAVAITAVAPLDEHRIHCPTPVCRPAHCSGRRCLY